MTEAELRALVRLRCVPGLGEVTLTRRLREYGSATALLDVPREVLGEHGAERDSARTLRRLDRVIRTIDELELQVFSPGCNDYPERLRALRTPPVLLFARGDTALLRRPGVAVVGTRSPTEYGTSATEQLVSGLARAGLVIWSGGARGIDGVAHATTLAEGGATGAVLGCGVDVVYPPEHGELFELIAERGLLLSEFLPGEPPIANNFPRRNRIIAYLSHGVLVVEARPDGGALITAEHAADVVPIMAVPGPIGRVTSVGPNRLIQTGAKLVMDVRDVLEELGGPLHAEAARPRPSAKRHWRRVPAGRSRRAAVVEKPASDGGGDRPAGQPVTAPPGKRGSRAPAPTLPPGQDRVYAVLRAHPQHVDVVARRAGLGISQVLELLLELELAGHAVALGGKRYRRPPAQRHRRGAGPAAGAGSGDIDSAGSREGDPSGPHPDRPQPPA